MKSKNFFWMQKGDVQWGGIEPPTSAVLKPRHNQLDHLCTTAGRSHIYYIYITEFDHCKHTPHSQRRGLRVRPLGRHLGSAHSRESHPDPYLTITTAATDNLHIQVGQEPQPQAEATPTRGHAKPLCGAWRGASTTPAQQSQRLTRGREDRKSSNVNTRPGEAL